MTKNTASYGFIRFSKCKQFEEARSIFQSLLRYPERSAYKWSIFSYVKLVCKGVSSYVQIVCKGVSDSGRNVYGDYKGGNMAYWLHAPHLSYHLHVPLLCGVGLKAEAMLRRHWLLFGLVTKFEDGFVSLYSFNFLMNLLLQIVNGRHRQAMSV